MNVLVIGGNRFVGRLLVWRLLARGDKVTLLNRGTLPDPFGQRVERLRADRTTDAFNQALQGRRFDATVDFAAFHREDIDRVVQVLGPNAGHYMLLGTGQVYLVCPEAPRPSVEKHFDLSVMKEPEKSSPDWKEWEYGVGKRGCEEAVVEAEKKGVLKATRWRIPMVNGVGDYYRRLESYLWRLLDGGPVLIAEGRGNDCRHVYADDVAWTMLHGLGRESHFGKVFNLSQDTSVPLRFLIEMMADRLGTNARIIELPIQTLVQAGLAPEKISPFSQKWMSCLDPSLAKSTIGFRPTPLNEYVPGIVTQFLMSTPSSPPESYATRAQELALVS
jgi:nucleoside-diphosphate-sugar epimerase